MSDILHEDQPSQPWFKDKTGPHPFTLVKKLVSDNPNCGSFRTVAIFPWSFDSLGTLWDGGLNTPEHSAGWKDMISDLSGTIAVGGDSGMYVLSLRKTRNPICVKIPDAGQADRTHVRNVAWAISQHNHLEPLVLFSGSSVLYIFNLMKRKVVGYLRGHGGPINSIAVHPIHPSMFCTTSDDFTSRIYDLTLTPRQTPNNPHWPPGTTPSLAGAAHGLDMHVEEGHGIGRCVLVLMGGRSGGHRAAVLGAAFHSALPLIATCGLDRVVKIWYIPSLDGEKLAREDKPIFSSNRIHKARVLSVNWLSHDVLLTHSAPAYMRRDPDKVSHDLYLEEGTMVLWRWLGVDRFFPPGQPYQKVLRGCASDYQESSSFKLVSIYSLPTLPTEHANISSSPNLQVYQSPYHDPLILLIPDPNTLCVVNVVHFSPRKPPSFPYERNNVVEMTKRMRLDDDDNEDAGNGQDKFDKWTIDISGEGQAQVADVNKKLEACVMGLEGRIIVGVGSQGTVWLWMKGTP